MNQFGHAGRPVAGKQALVQQGKAPALQRGRDGLAAVLAKAGLQRSHGATAMAREGLHVERLLKPLIQVFECTCNASRWREGSLAVAEKPRAMGALLSPDERLNDGFADAREQRFIAVGCLFRPVGKVCHLCLKRVSETAVEPERRPRKPARLFRPAADRTMSFPRARDRA